MKELNMKDPLFTGRKDLNKNILKVEVVAIVNKLKCKKVMGLDNIPNEV